MSQTKLSLEQRLERIEKLLGVDGLDDLDTEKLELKVKAQLQLSSEESKKDCELTDLHFLGRPYQRCV